MGLAHWRDEFDTMKQPATRGLAPRDSGPLCLLVSADGVFTTYALPEKGEVIIGRSSSANVHIDHPSVSRKHARLTIGERLTIEDLESSNGMRLKDRRIDPHKPVEVAVGQLIELGQVMLFLRRAAPTARPRRIWPHGYFEARLEEQCERAGPFSVLRLSVETPQPGALDEAFVALRPLDVLALYAPNEYEILLSDTEPAEANQLAEAVRGPLERRGVRIKMGMAHHPIDGDNPETLIARACDAVRDQPPAAAEGGMQSLRQLAAQVAKSDLCVLILGETGVGKEVMAETIHQLSPRSNKKFLRLHCAAISETLLESELFGHERGAFTGAHAAKPGLFETADGGTVLLDEIGELPLAIQVKLLRVIEERKVLRVGGVEPRPIDVRFIAATNRELESEVAAGRFRSDLYFRLNGVTLWIPPLRERKDEIEHLAKLFVSQACRRLKLGREPALAHDAIKRLIKYEWPGNVRELRNTVERAVVLCGTDAAIRSEHLPTEKMAAALLARNAQPAPAPTLSGPISSAPPAFPNVPTDVEPEITSRVPKLGSDPNLPRLTGDGGLAAELESLERQRILNAMEECAGNQSRAARLLGISRNTLISRLDQYGIKRPRK
jgi:DNA-binding NtrC family response regulator